MATKKIKVNIETQDPGTLVEIVGLGLVENGGTLEVDELRAKEFENTYGLEVVDEEIHVPYIETGPTYSNVPDEPDPLPVEPEKDKGPVSTPPATSSTPPVIPPTPDGGNV
jgi:hypothetical protein